jgi:8-oxo-dGTP diphosphatase
MTKYVVGFLFDTLHRYVVLIKKNRPDWQKGKLNGVGGHIEDGETPLDAMIREFYEETGAHVSDWEQFCVMYNDDFECYAFKAFVDKFDVMTCTDEEIRLCPLHNIEPCLSNLHWLIPMALDGNSGGHNYCVSADITG